jgi:hypothetical protein
MECRRSTLSLTGKSTLLLEPGGSRFIDLIGSHSVSLYFLFPIAPSFFFLLVVPSFCSHNLPDYLRFNAFSICFDFDRKTKRNEAKELEVLRGSGLGILFQFL